MFRPALTVVTFALLATPALADNTPEQVENALSPAKLDFDKIDREGVAEEYLSRGPEVDLGAIIAVFSMFRDSSAVAYAAWFN